MSNVVLNTGINAQTDVAFPVGATRVRLFCNEAATVTIDWRGENITGSNPDASIGTDHISDWAIPPGAKAAVFKRRDAGTRPISVAIG